MFLVYCMMDHFIEYLQKAKKFVDTVKGSSTSRVHVTIGNESCDLDSMISAVALSYFYHQENLRKSPNCTCILHIPVLNIPSDEFPLRTENCYILKKVGISQSLLIFRNDIDFEGLQKCGLISTSLVDHHVLRPEDQFLEQTVTDVFDHRPIDPNIKWDKNKVQVIIKEVGSCATIIADKILRENPEILCSTLATLLYDVITFDTVAYSSEAGRVKDLDIAISKKLTEHFALKDAKALFDELWTAHNDISHLTAEQLLSKDLKIIEGLPVPGLPILVAEYLKRPNVLEDMTSFCETKNASSMIIIGLHVIDGQVHRDIATFTLGNDKSLIDAIIANLKDAPNIKGYDFCLQQVDLEISNVTYFVQQNIKLTRKHILPLIKDVLVQHRDCINVK